MDDGRRLFEVFAAHLPADARGRAAQEAPGAEIAAYVEAARASWPDLALGSEDFVRHVAERAESGAVPPVAHAPDLYLACACVRRVPGAVDAFHRTFGAVVARVLARRRATADVADDATQVVHERLLVGRPDAPPKIAEYTGRGPLRSWVSTTAATTLLMMRRASGRRREDDDGALARHAVALEPELAYMKERYKAELESAIVGALERLKDRDRALLRLHLGERLSIDRIGALYKVDRSTAARWLASAREALIDTARKEARTRLRLTDDECDSIAALVRSDLHVSVARLLGST